MNIFIEIEFFILKYILFSRNILCFPICDEANIIGVAQLCNKVIVYILN